MPWTHHSPVRAWFAAHRGVGAALLVLLAAAPVVALTMPEGLRIPMVAPHAKGEPPDAALFSHWSHSSYTCLSCHPGTFPQRRVGFTHADMAAERYCGRCHNGAVAFEPRERGVSCETCHVPTKKPDIDEDDLWE